MSAERQLQHAFRPAELSPGAAGALDGVPVAIIGIGCRLPGGVVTPAQFWQLLMHGMDTVGDVPASRFDAERFYHPKPSTPGRINTRHGAFLDSIDQFDAAFFGISPREAERMDPQQRLLLEVAWEAFEDAGVLPEHAAQRERTGVFIGMMEAGYEDLLFRDLGTLDVLGLNGAGKYGSAGRVSYCFRLSGPSVAVDTACSSSLVSAHLACQSIRAGESTMALAGGAHIILRPHHSICFSQGGMLAADGRCKFGDEQADGFGRAEAVGLILLERLDRALANGRRIYAVIRGGAIGSYGQSEGAMPRPSVEAQAANLREAYRAAGVPPRLVQYVEAHGTGTRAGDGTELRALGTVLGPGRAEGDELAVGSVKTNLAHAEAASGIAGLIKLALSLHHRYLPRSLHVQKLNPKIPWSELSVRMQSEGAAWPAPSAGTPRYAGINNFGISGTNAHLVLEEAPAAPPMPATESERAELLPLSARSAPALLEQARAYQALFEAASSTGGEPSVANITRASATTRTQHAHRLSVVARSRADFAAALSAFARGVPHPGVAAGRALLEPGRNKVAFVFSGHGAQWLGMGRQLLRSEPSFASAIEAADAAIRRYSDWSLLEQLAAEPHASRLAENDVVQPVLFGVATALAALWRSWGIEPDAVVGHSMGEIAAMHVAGALSLDDAARVVCLRSQLLARIMGQGRMVMVELSEDEARQALEGRDASLAIAVIQSARATVLSGSRRPLEELVAELEGRGVYCRWVKVDYASHGPHIEPLEKDLLQLLAPVKPRAGSCPIYSSLLNETIDGSQCDARYWYENLRRPVRFAGAIQRLLADGHGLFVETSPHPLLVPAIAPAIGNGLVVSSLRRGEDERAALLESLGALYVAGYPVSFERMHGGPLPGAASVALPTYPFQRQRYWFSPAPQRAQHSGHPLIGPKVTSSLDAKVHLFEAELGPRDLPYLADHAVEGVVVLPGVSYLEMALAAGRALRRAGSVAALDTTFAEPLVFASGESRSVQVALTELDGDRAEYRISSRSDHDPWRCHARGTLLFATAAEQPPGPAEPAAAIAGRLTSVAAEEFYTELAQRGLNYGPSFRGVSELAHDTREAIARISSQESLREPGYQFHPALLDACLHPLLALVGASNAGPVVPSALAQLRVHGPLPAELWSHAVLMQHAGRRLVGDIRLIDGDGQVVVELLGLAVVQLERRALSDDVSFSLDLAPLPAPATTADPSRGPGSWLLVGEAGTQAAGIRAALEARGETVLVAPWRGDAVDFTSVATYTEVLEAWERQGQRKAGILHIGSLDQPDAPSQRQLELGTRLGPGSVLHLVQTLVAAGWRDLPRLYLVTRGAQPCSPPAQPSISGSALLGLGRVLAYEHPELRVTRIDLESPLANSTEEALASLVLADGPADELVLRGGNAFAVQLVRGRRPQRNHTTYSLRGDRTYLITGGRGGLGQALARWLVEHGAKHVCLLGRSGPAGRVEELSTGGANVYFEPVDVADRECLARCLTNLSPALAGVFHAAGLLDDGLVVGQSFERFREVMAPKIMGAWNLHELTSTLPLEQFVLYSSAASLVGTPGQSAYAAANAFLDGLAHYRRSLGLPALSINWGTFSEVGLAASQENRGERLRSRGFTPFTPDEGTAMLGELLASPNVPPQLGVMRFNARQWVEFHPQISGSSYFAKLLEDNATGGTTTGSVLDRLRSAGESHDARLRAMEAFVAESAAQVLRLDPAKIDRQMPLREAGFDSLMALEFRNRLESALALRLPATLLWVHPTLQGLALHLTNEVFGRVDAPSPALAVDGPAQQDAREEAALQGLSEAERHALLEKALAELDLGV